MYRVFDWAEVHRLHRQGVSKAAIARQLGMSRTTVWRLVSMTEPAAYRRKRMPSLLDRHLDQIAAMLAEDPKAPATVLIQRLRRDGYAGGITILKDYLAKVRPSFLAAKAYQRTSYLPGEIAQLDWWHTGVEIPVGKDATREAFGLVATLPASAAHASTFTLGRTIGDLLPAALRCFSFLGGVPEKIVCDNDVSIVKARRGGRAILHAEVAAFFGALGARVVVLQPRRPQSKGQVERTNGYLETSFLPLRRFADLADLQGQHDDWTVQVAYRRHHRRVGARVGDALRSERGFLRPIPEPPPQTDRRTEARITRDGFCRVGDVDYSVPPGLVGRRVQVHVSLSEVTIFHEGHLIASHRRSYVPADVVLAPEHARALRLAREARSRLERTTVEIEDVDLARYDALVEVAS